MKYCRFDDDRIGVVRGETVHDVTGIVEELPAVRYPYPPGDALVAGLGALRGAMERLADAAPGLPVSRAAVPEPGRQPDQDHGHPGQLPGPRRGGPCRTPRSASPPGAARSRSRVCS